MFPPRFESSFNIHPRFFYTPLIFIFFLRFASRASRDVDDDDDEIGKKNF